MDESRLVISQYIEDPMGNFHWVST